MIVPRWEWRSFGQELGEAGAVFAELPVEQVVESTELYVVSATGTDVVKVRDDLMDIKHLQEVSEDGLEQWTPVMKARFPLSPSELDAVTTALGVAVTAPARDEYPLDVVLDEVVGPNPDLLAVDVHKRRVRYRIGGCMAELTEVRTERAATNTVAIESEDPALVMAVLRDLGLATYPNVNFGRGLRVLERFGPERFAVIDVGTNSVKFHIGERTADGDWRTVVDRAEVTRLGDGLRETGRLGPEPTARTVEAIAAMVEEAKQQRVGAIAAVGTAGLRIAGNAADFVRAVQNRCGVVVEVISGEDEARLAYLAATTGLPVRGPSVVFDTGGGSSQFSFGERDRVDERFSVEVGAVRFTEQFALDGVVSDDDLAAALAAIGRDLDRLDGRDPPETLIAMGGAVTNLAAVKHALAAYHPDVVQGTVLDRDEIDRQIELYRTRTADERRSIVGLQPARAEVILAGACIVRTVLDKLGADSLTVSDRGLRYGVLAERFGTRGTAAR
ncbi:MAG TPA: Ppx/GppA family phosphatase [Nocardioides sp.]|uniref:Ppx/GppA phosphatase family protein n=1 Tax=Nocardioides sp. TaxID=35761 RepID=UPI002E328EA4|nr:Ppx/GppA family phosphatase [Nocardioides sp.]HEX5088984.1 Ppx/GppA family phosphatase [Nocardioides sp.]